MSAAPRPRASRTAAAWLAAAAWLVASPARGQEKEEPAAPVLVDYVIKPGDSCDAIAARLFGDPKRVDLIHKYNNLGQPPHKLTPGDVLRLPPPTSRAAGADAKVTHVRNDVEAYTPGRHPAGSGEPLMRGHRVRTLSASSAEITFNDKSRLQLGENTLVVILGDTSTKASQSATSADTTLMNGSLRAHLGALAGGGAPQPLRISTASGKIDVGGETRVQVDRASTTRVAAYRGTSRVQAAGKQVDVPAGFGTRVDKGKPPEAPRKLPAPPVWKAPPKVIGASGLLIDVAADYAPGKGSGPVARWHVELARDERFNDLVLDSRVPAQVTHFEALELKPGEYYLRVSGVDRDELEGPAGEVIRFAVSPIKIVEAGQYSSQITVPPGLFCGIDGAPLTAAKGPFEVRTTRPRKLRCATSADGQGAVETTLPPSKLGQLAAEATLARGGKAREGRVMVRFKDAGGEALAELAPSAEASEGALVEAFAEEEPGVYAATVRWEPGLRAFTLKFAVPGAEATSEAEIVVNEPPAPRVPDAPAAPEPASTRLELGLLAGGAFAGVAAGPAIALEIGLERRLGASAALSLGLRPGYERYLGDARREIVAVGLPIGLRLRALDARWFPYVAAHPALIIDRPFAEGGGRANQVAFAPGGLLGAQLQLGAAGLFLEAAGRAGIGAELPFVTISAGARAAQVAW